MRSLWLDSAPNKYISNFMIQISCCKTKNTTPACSLDQDCVEMLWMWRKMKISKNSRVFFTSLDPAEVKNPHPWTGASVLEAKKHQHWWMLKINEEDHNWKINEADTWKFMANAPHGPHTLDAMAVSMIRERPVGWLEELSKPLRLQQVLIEPRRQQECTGGKGREACWAWLIPAGKLVSEIGPPWMEAHPPCRVGPPLLSFGS